MDNLKSEEIKLLLERQLNPMIHPYTCKCGLVLYPTKDYWVCGVCGYYQKYGNLEMKIVGRTGE